LASTPWPDDPDAYLLAYMDAWNQADLDRICDAYHVPALIYKRGRVVAIPDEAAKRTYFGELLGRTRPELEGGARWERPTCRATSLGRDSAMVTVRWILRRHDGSVLEDYLDSYHLIRIAGRWAFLGDTVHPD
jgi:hypothetical protein